MWVVGDGENRERGKRNELIFSALETQLKLEEKKQA